MTRSATLDVEWSADVTAKVLELKDISKRFGSIIANEAVGLEIEPGEIRGLVGENGAGKSTLANITAGLYRPDSGCILVDGQGTRFHGPADAMRAGINMVHQNFLLAENLTAAENIVLGVHGHGPWLDVRRAEVQVRELAEHYGLPVRPSVPIWSMPLAERQRVAILTTLFRDCRLLILDEPTSVLSPFQIDRLLAAVRRIAAEGRSVIFITHKLHEVMSVSDRVTVMRKGRVVGTLEHGGLNAQVLANLMMGGNTVHESRRADLRRASGPPTLSISALTVLGDYGQVSVDGLDVEVREAEIVGLAGVDGNGQTELLEAIAGLRKPAAGRIVITWPRPHTAPPRVAHIPDDARGVALIDPLSITWNIGLRFYRRSRRPRPRWLMDYGWLRRFAAELIQKLDIRGATPETRVAALSGGNRQKLILARELSLGAQLLIAMNPTAGLDVGATQRLHDRMLASRERGTAILLASNDLDEILELSDRVAVIYRGRIHATLDRKNANRRTVGLLMGGVLPEAKTALSTT
jgi:simple sugar transport system ATP-binding protein